MSDTNFVCFSCLDSTDGEFETQLTILHTCPLLANWTYKAFEISIQIRKKYFVYLIKSEYYLINWSWNYIHANRCTSDGSKLKTKKWINELFLFNTIHSFANLSAITQFRDPLKSSAQMITPDKGSILALTILVCNIFCLMAARYIIMYVYYFHQHGCISPDMGDIGIMPWCQDVLLSLSYPVIARISGDSTAVRFYKAYIICAWKHTSNITPENRSSNLFNIELAYFSHQKNMLEPLMV